MAKIKAKDLIKIAENEVGYLEKKTNKNLDHKTKNAGYNNYTKYGKWYGALMGVGNPNPWCAFFVSWCIFEATGRDDLTETKRLLGGNIFSYCPTGVNQFKNKKQWHTKNPEVGDIIFFHNNIRSHHTGIVYKVDNKNVYTIEGNTGAGVNNVEPNGGGVFKKQYSLNNSRILGYGRPDYIKEIVLTKPSKDWVLKLQKELNKQGYKDKGGKKLVENGIVDAKTKQAVPSLKLTANGNLVKIVQERMVELGYSTNGIDGKFGKGTGQAVQEIKKDFMGAKNPKTTIGSLTWDVLLGVYKK